MYLLAELVLATGGSYCRGRREQRQINIMEANMIDGAALAARMMPVLILVSSIR